MNPYVQFAAKLLNRKKALLPKAKDAGDYYDNKDKELKFAFSLVKTFKDNEAFLVTESDLSELNGWLDSVANTGD